MKLILQAIKALFRKVENAIEDVRKSIPEVAQANWSQNDRTKPDYVKNRTHYTEEKAFEDIAWDGDTEGRDIGYINDNNIFYKVSDKLLSVEDLIGATAAYTSGDVHYLDEDHVKQESEDLINIDLNAGVVILAPTTYRGTVFPSTGVYFLLNNGTYHITELKAKETVHKIDAKYLPDGIPNEEQIAETMQKASEPCLILETNTEYYDFASSASTSLLGEVRIASGSFSAVKQQIADGKDPIVIFRGGVSTNYNGNTWQTKFCLKSKAVYYNKSNIVFLYFELETFPSNPSNGKNIQITIRGESSSIVNASYIEK